MNTIPLSTNKVTKVYIYNLDQAYFYIANGIKPIEPPQKHYITHKIFFVFDKNTIKDVNRKWMTNKINYKNHI